MVVHELWPQRGGRTVKVGEEAGDDLIWRHVGQQVRHLRIWRDMIVGPGDLVPVPRGEHLVDCPFDPEPVVDRLTQRAGG